MNVLIGDISSYKAIVVARYIRKQYPSAMVYTFDYRKFTKGIRTKHSHKNFIVQEDDLASLREIIEEYKIDHFVPVINERLAKFWEKKDFFLGALDYLGAFDTYQILNDKLVLHKLATELGVQVPARFDTLQEAVVPFIIKPTNLSSAKGVQYIMRGEDIPASIPETDMIIQQYVAGEGVGYSFYCKEGEICDGYGHRRLAEFPATGGSSTYRTSYTDERMVKAASTIVKELNYTGFAMFEFKLSSSNELYLLEVNPRIWGSVNQGLSNGTNYFRKILGEAETPTKNNTKSINTYVGPLIYLSFLQYLMKLKWAPVGQFFKNITNSSPDVHFLKDPGAYLSTILRKLL